MASAKRAVRGVLISSDSEVLRRAIVICGIFLSLAAILKLSTFTRRGSRISSSRDKQREGRWRSLWEGDDYNPGQLRPVVCEDVE